MRSKILQYSASLAAAALMSLVAVQGARAQELSAVGDVAAPPELRVTFDATVAEQITLAATLVGGAYDTATEGSYTFTATSTGTQLSGPAYYAFKRGATETSGFYGYNISNAISSSGLLATSNVYLNYKQDAASNPPNRLYSKQVQDMGTVNAIADLDPVSLAGYDIGGPFSPNAAYYGTAFNISTSTSIPVTATSDPQLDTVAGITIADSDVAGDSIVGILSITAKYVP